MTPVLRTIQSAHQFRVCRRRVSGSHSQIGLALFEGLVLPLDSFPVRISSSSLANTGGSVPPTGPFILLLSVILQSEYPGIWES